MSENQIFKMMSPKLLPYLSPIRRLCEQHEVERMWVFGSATSSTAFDENSDIDLLVEFRDIDSGRKYLENYYSLFRELQKLFNRKVDLLELTKFRNPIFREEVMKSRELLFGYEKEASKVSG